MAQRYSIVTFRPSMYPASFTPCRNAATLDAYPLGELLWRNPITGIAGCCAAPAAATLQLRRRQA
jgi:hypothetical protein